MFVPNCYVVYVSFISCHWLMWRHAVSDVRLWYQWCVQQSECPRTLAYWTKETGVKNIVQQAFARGHSFCRTCLLIQMSSFEKLFYGPKHAIFYRQSKLFYKMQWFTYLIIISIIIGYDVKLHTLIEKMKRNDKGH